jgi:23S rRNA pseudouridine1911/1915/1917 synthase
VRLNGRGAKPSAVLSGADEVECDPPPVRSAELEPESGELEPLYEDPEIAVLNKPAGLTMHPGAGRRGGTLAHRLLARYPETAGVGGPGRPGIVHRLDRDTTGAVVVARTSGAYLRLTQAFAERRVQKRYLAIAYGTLREATGTISTAIGRHPVHRHMMTVRPQGRPARTGYRMLAASHGIALIELDLATGRTHQIRVHLKSIGHPLVGDPIYGEERWHALPKAQQRTLAEFPRPALHAWRITFPHPNDGRAMSFEAPFPADLRELWGAATGQEPSLPAPAPPLP